MKKKRTTALATFDKIAFIVSVLIILPVMYVLAADTLQTFTGAGGGGAITATYRPGYQTWEKVRANFVTLNAYLFTGTATPEAAVAASVGAIFRRTDGGDGTSDYVKSTGAGNTGWSALPTLTSTGTFTNKTYDVEGTGNVFTVVEKRWLPSAICQNATAVSAWSTPTTSPAVFACNTGTNTQKGTADFADSADLSMQTALLLPADWAGTIDVRMRWFTSATSGNVVWQVSSISAADGETSDPAFNTASTVTDAAKGVTLQDNDASITGLTITGVAAGEMLYLKVRRDSAHASDTLAATASLRGIELTLRRAM